MKHNVKSLTLAAALMVYLSPAVAGVQDDMNSFFNNMGYATNTTTAKAWQGQAARYMSGGSFFARTGNKNIQLVSISLPSVSSGCGGIDVYLGAFSFINSDQIVAFVKQVMSNAPGYLFDLALKTTVPELAAAKDFVQKLATDVNRFNMSSCQAAQAAIGSVASMWGVSQQTICQSVAGQNNVFSDWVASRQGCTSGGDYGRVVDKAKGSDKDQVLYNTNLMWDALANGTLSSSQELRQFAMSVSGTVIFDDQGKMRVLPPIATDRSVINIMMNGGSATIYVCDNGNKCLAPTPGKVTIAADKSLVSLVSKTLTSISNKAISDEALTQSEKDFINSTSIPILSWIVDQSSLSVSVSLFAQLADYIACDVYLQYLEAVVKVVNGSLATKDYPAESMRDLRRGIGEAQAALNSLRAEVQVKESALISAQQQIRFVRQQVSSQMTDRYMGNYQFSRTN
jgi:conjugative transfer pilus assembly protein TraH